MSVASVLDFKENKFTSVLKSMAGKIDLVTKRLKIQKISKTSKKRKLVVSTNWLPLFGYNKDTSVVENIIGPEQGLSIKFAQIGDKDIKKVYSRSYKNREDETQLDIRHQSKLDVSLGEANYVHITFRVGNITILPENHIFERVIDKTLDVELEKKDGLYSEIIPLIASLKQTPYQQVVINSDDAFFDSQEHTLLSMQLRRLGYHLHAQPQQLIANASKETDLKSLDVVNYSPITPPNLRHKMHKRFNQDEPLSTFAACTGGVDLFAMEEDGFTITSTLEVRPVEQRDITYKKDKVTGKSKQNINDKTEHCAISAAINTRGCKHIFNEDIFLFKVKSFINEISTQNFFHFSLQCSDFSPLKSLKERLKAILNLSSTRDMIFPALAIVEEAASPTLMVENVPNFSSSIECRLFVHQLKQLGYEVHKVTLSGHYFSGGYTKRKRSFIFASLLPVPFAFPKPVAPQDNVSVWHDIIKPAFGELRDVTHTKSVQKGITTGRIRTIKENDCFAPTFFKAQNRQVKDSVYVHIGGKYYFPSVNMIREMMGIPNTFNLSPFSQEMKTELLGQSVEFPMHQAIMRSVKKHLDQFLDLIAASSLAPNKFRYDF